MSDKLGVTSFLVQPIQRLPKLKLFLENIINTTKLDLNGTQNNSIANAAIKYQLALCCRAEKSLERLLKTVNDAFCISDMIEYNDVNIIILY